MPSPYQQSVLDRVLDGKRLWSNADAGGDADVFYTEVVTPLRELRYEGVIEDLIEITSAIDGDVVIIGAEIVGPVNYHHKEEEE